MTKVAILWHMHQPYYQDLASGEHVMPWVRLHALKDYYGMVALLREFPDVRMTFNLVPSLLAQLEAFAEDRASDRSLDLSLKAADALDDADVEFILENFFHAHRQHMIEAYPRYAELLARRGEWQTADRRAAAARFSRDDLRDLQVWHKLAWVDPLYQDRDPRVRRLMAKARDYSEDDKALLRSVELEILNKVIPEYREAAARQQIEISASPFYHPILPLLCDSDIYLRTHPLSRMRRRFIRPEDAAEQLARATACLERLFGRKPVGLWPSEGSVSDAIVPLVAAAGFQWIATDELILARTLGTDFSRDRYGHVEQPERLYEPYALSAGGATVSCAFRDHTLSDLIGFTYARWDAEVAADDFVSRLLKAGQRYRDKTGGEEACIFIILDGENAWEHFPGGGRPFLRALYGRLAGQELRTVTMAEACATPVRKLTSIFPGSWIDANFYIWIGHADDQKGWCQLAEARDALEASSAGPEAIAEAREEILIAEGSDWFWWYGDDHSSDHDLEFDDLFRRHLRNVYRRLQKPVPEELYVSNISAGAPAPALTAPSARLSPTIDGEDTNYFEWLGAGTLEVREVSGAMHQTDRAPSRLTSIRFGCDRERLFVRIAAVLPMADLLADGQNISLNFRVPDEVRFTVHERHRRVTGVFWDRRSPSGWIERGPAGAVVAAGTVLEVALPLLSLGVAVGGPVSFFVAVCDRDGVEQGRHPEHRPIELVAPDEQFEARNWRA